MITRKKQQGVTLIISLLILVMMTLIGTTTIRTTTMEERMAGNMRDHNLAFQAAESSLRDGEALVDGLVNTNDFDGSNGLFGDGQSEPGSLFSVATWDANSYGYTGAALDKLASQPRYMVKIVKCSQGDTETLNVEGYGRRELGTGGAIFRITGRGTGGSDQSQVVLRSNYGRTGINCT